MTTPDIPNPYVLPPDLPAPDEDGACNHLPGMQIPDLRLYGSDGNYWSLLALTQGKVVIYVYPATGIPGRDPIPGWDTIPGAPGCTVQSLGFRDQYTAFKLAGIDVVGLSSQDTVEQQEFSQRMGISFLLLSDPSFLLYQCLELPVFEAHGRRFYKRLAMFAEDNIIHHVFYPIFSPNTNAELVLAWLKERTGFA